MNKKIKFLTIPEHCPVCGGLTKLKTENSSTVLVCTNPNCKGKLLGKFSHFVSQNAMNIEGLSEATLEKFINLGWIESFIDIYYLEDYKDQICKLEGFGNNGDKKYDSDFVKEGRTNNLRAVFSGHAHNADWTVDYDGVILGLGVKTGPELYYKHIDVNSEKKEMKDGLASVGINENFDLLGASLVTITDNDNFELEHVYYNERGENDFVRWVKW